jgi:hypothetical protein
MRYIDTCGTFAEKASAEKRPGSNVIHGPVIIIPRQYADRKDLKHHTPTPLPGAPVKAFFTQSVFFNGNGIGSDENGENGQYFHAIHFINGNGNGSDENIN